MKWLHPYEPELELAFTEAETILATFPNAFRKPALDYLDRFHVMKEKRSKNYICYLLPFWMQKVSGIAPAEARQFAVANIFGMMYYHLIDACMDEPESGVTQLLPMAELIHSQFIQWYSSFFPVNSHPKFWAYFNKYVAQWAGAVSSEQTSDYFYDNPIKMGHKAAPIKLTIAGQLMLVDKEDYIHSLEEAVDTVLVTLQLIDDWKDWEMDLKEGNYNSLISVTQRIMEVESERRPTFEEMKQAISVHDALMKLTECGDHNHESLQRIQSSLPDLFDFHEYLRNNLKEGAVDIQTQRKMLLNGGLELWLSKNM